LIPLVAVDMAAKIEYYTSVNEFHGGLPQKKPQVSLTSHGRSHILAEIDALYTIS